jgi:hypothetical protein
MHADGVGQDEGLSDFIEVSKDPSLGEIWIAAENLNLADAKVRAAELAIEHPGRRYFILPVLLRKVS